MTSEDRISPSAYLLLCGDNQTKVWGVSASERVRRMAARFGLAMAGAAGESRFPLVLANTAFAFDPAWLRFVADNPGHVVTFAGRPVLAHLRSEDLQMAQAVAAAMTDDAVSFNPAGLSEIAFEQGAEIYNPALRKRERPFLAPLAPDTVAAVERASYYGAYKGVTDFLTKYVWPELALHVTRLAARLGLSPNMVTAIGALLCIAATYAFFEGRYWLGLVLGFIFMVLDTVDGKLARCTVTSSRWGDIFDHGIDLVHPPFWWWAWGAGLAAYGRPMEEAAFYWVLAVIIAGYVLQRIIEGAFIRAHGMHIHVWRPVDSAFRLVTARRNPNMAILLVSMAFARPDIGLYAVAAWTVASLFFHAARLAQAAADKLSGKQVVSWLS